MSAGFANVTSITSCCRQHVKRIKGYSTMNIRLTLRDYQHNKTPKDRKILLTTSASFFKALAVLNNFCCSKNEYICPYTRLGTAAILTPQARGQMFFWWTPLKMRTLALNYGITRQGNRVWKENLSPFPFNEVLLDPPFPNNYCTVPSCFEETWNGKNEKYRKGQRANSSTS